MARRRVRAESPGMLAVTVHYQNDQNDRCGDVQQQFAPLSRPGRSTLARANFVCVWRTGNRFRTLLPIGGRFNLERQQLAELRPPTILRKGRNVNEDFLIALDRRDEAKAAVVNPLDQLAV
jgi:hypothetical protein